MEALSEETQRKKFKVGNKIKIFIVGLFLVLLIGLSVAYYKYDKEVGNSNIENINIKKIIEEEYGYPVIETVGSNSSIKNPLTNVNPRTSFLNASGNEIAYITHSGDIGGIGNLTFNISSSGGGYGFFQYLGEQVKRISKGWFVNLDVSQNVNSSNVTALDVYQGGARVITSETDPVWTGNVSNVAFINKENIFGAFNQSFDTNVLFIDATNDRVGIGTTIPEKSLHIEKDISGGELIRLKRITAGYNLSGSIGITNDSLGQSVYIGRFEDGSNFASLKVYENEDVRVGSPLFVQTSTARVGIGTTSPQNTLNVVGTFNVTQNAIFGQNITMKGTNDVVFYNNGTHLIID